MVTGPDSPDRNRQVDTVVLSVLADLFPGRCLPHLLCHHRLTTEGTENPQFPLGGMSSHTVPVLAGFVYQFDTRVIREEGTSVKK